MSRVGLGQGRVVSRRAVLALVAGLVALGASSALAQRPSRPASLTITMAAARRIGLTVPPSILVRADRVID